MYENGEPRVVYHGTYESFHTFDKNKAGIGNDPGMRGKGFYLSTNRRTSEGYGNNIMECFVNLKNPFNPFDFASKKDIASALNIEEDAFEFIPHERFVVGDLFSGLLRASLENAGMMAYNISIGRNMSPTIPTKSRARRTTQARFRRRIQTSVSAWITTPKP